MMRAMTLVGAAMVSVAIPHRSPMGARCAVRGAQCAVTAARSEVADTATSDFEINGLHVIVRRNTSTDVIAANLYLLGGSQQLTTQTQGIEALVLAASGKGRWDPLESTCRHASLSIL